jgi:antitoxin component YwqK of YwqJK toxin-antitoxin module
MKKEITPEIFKNYYPSGKIRSKDYYLRYNDKLHRIDGPAYIYYYESGKIYTVGYYINGQKHRLDGPAEIDYNCDGIIVFERDNLLFITRKHTIQMEFVRNYVRVLRTFLD